MNTNDWQPIKTAPKDETPMLLAWDNFSFAAIGRWMDGRWMDPRIDAEFNLNPSHWMPLPAPPPVIVQDVGENPREDLIRFPDVIVDDETVEDALDACIIEKEKIEDAAEKMLAALEELRSNASRYQSAQIWRVANDAIAAAHAAGISFVEWGLSALEQVKAAGPQATRPLEEFMAELRARKHANDLDMRPFKPCVYVVPNMALTVMQLADTTIVWRPWGPFEGHAVDLGYDTAGNLVGIQIWDDVAKLKARGGCGRMNSGVNEARR